MKYRTLRVFISLLIIVIIADSLPAATYHVAKDGNDANPGTEGAPFLTIGKATQLAGAGDLVIIHQGIYKETVRPNSGSAGNPLIFRSAPGDRVVISAMEALSGWSSDGGGRYKKTVGWDLGQLNFIMNEETPMDLARWPNNTDGDPYSLNSRRNTGGSNRNTTINANLIHNEIPDYDWTGGSLLFYGDAPGSGWTTWKAFITSSSNDRVNFDFVNTQSWIYNFHAPADGGEYYLEGVKDALDYQNEWYFDENTSTLFVQLPGGAAPADGQISMRRRDLTFDLNGRSYVHIEDLAVYGGGIEINGAGNRIAGVSSFYGSHHRGVSSGLNSGGRAIFVKWNATNTIIERCEVAYGSGTGVWDAGDFTIIDNCHIHDFNYVGMYDGCIMARDGNSTTVSNNTLYRSGRDVLQIINKGSNIFNNDFSQSNLVADDCALLYTISPGLDMDIHHNLFHDTQGRGSLKKAAGIYLDNSAGDVRVHHNVIYNTEWSNIQINWDGANIDVFNNTLWDGEKAMGAWHLAGTMFTNVKVWNNLTNRNSLEPQSDKQNNLVMAESANPFVNAGELNFMLKPGEQAIDYGRVISGTTDGFQGSAPDAGAYETGTTPWTAGIDWDAASGPAGRCYGLPGEGCTPDTPFEQLPVMLTSFDAFKLGEKQSLLAWTSAEEIAFSHYEVERAVPDGTVFTTIGKVPAVGEEGTEGTYRFTDQLPVRGENRYRLKLVDIDGSFSYSGIRSLVFKEDYPAAAYPNPVLSGQPLLVSADEEKTTTVRLLDATGRMVSRLSFVANGEISTEGFTPGLYFLEMITGSERSVLKVVVGQ